MCATVVAFWALLRASRATGAAGSARAAGGRGGGAGCRRGVQALPDDVRAAGRAVARDPAAGGRPARRSTAGRRWLVAAAFAAGPAAVFVADQPAVHDRRLGRLVGLVPVPVEPADRPDDEHHLVLGCSGRTATRRNVAVQHDLATGRHRRRRWPALLLACALGWLRFGRDRVVSLAAGVRGDGVRVPAVQQGALAAVRALAAAVLRAAADPCRLDPGLLRRRRGDRHRLLPLAVPDRQRAAERRLRRAVPAIRADRGVGPGRAAGRAVRGFLRSQVVELPASGDGRPQHSRCENLAG